MCWCPKIQLQWHGVPIKLLVKAHQYYFYDVIIKDEHGWFPGAPAIPNQTANLAPGPIKGFLAAAAHGVDVIHRNISYNVSLGWWLVLAPMHTSEFIIKKWVETKQEFCLMVNPWNWQLVALDLPWIVTSDCFNQSSLDTQKSSVY